MSKLTGIALVMLVAAACNRSPSSAEPPRAASDEMDSMSQPAAMEPSGTDAQTHVAQGTINRVDAESGRVNISHEAVESAAWPAMTMDFQLADRAMAVQLRQGQRVKFHFSTEGGGQAVISRIEPLD